MKNRKIKFALCFFILSNFMGVAQHAEEMVVGIYSFNYLRGVRQVYPITVAGHISEKISCFEDISVLNESTFPVLGKAIEDSKEAESALAETVEQGRRKNAKKLITGFISAVEEEYDYRNRSLQVSIILDIGIVDVETGNMEASKQFIFQGLNTMGIYIKMALKKSGVDPNLVTVDDILAITGEKGIIKAIDKSLENLDRELFPFLSNYFGDFDNQCISGSASNNDKPSLPPINIGNKKNKEDVFSIVNKNTDNSILIETLGNNKWKKMTSFDILTEVEEEDLQGNTIKREVLIGTAKFKAYSGNYAVIELSKNNSIGVDEIVQSIKSGENVYVMYHQKNRATD